MAIVAVLAGHLVPERLPGGWLGVDMFFVLSGFLITRLLLDQLDANGRVPLGWFWRRRLSRLAPALLVMVAVTVPLALVVLSGERGRSAAVDAVAALGQVANWRFIASGQEYSGWVGGQSPLRHTWSLSTEGQFYLIWPLVLLAAARHLRDRRGRLALAVVSGCGAVASSTVMAVTASNGHLERAFNGSDTRAQALLVGCTLAALPLTLDRRSARWIGVSVAAAIAVLSAMFLLAGQADTWVYYGGVLAVALASAVLVVVGASSWGASALRPLTWRPVQWLGRASYSIYLWYWVVFTFMLDPAADRWGRPAASLLVLATVLLAGAASFRIVERSIPRQLQRRHTIALLLGVAAILAGCVAASWAPSRPAAVERAATPQDVPAPSDQDAGTPPLDGIERVLLVGDSIAHSLVPGFEAALGPHGIAFHSVAQPGCGILAGQQLDQFGAPVPWQAECDRAAAVATSALEDFDPDLVVAISTTEVADRVVEGEVVGVVDDPERIAELYGETLDRLSATGAKVLLVVTPPVPDQFVNERLPLLRDAMRSAGGRRPGVATVVDAGTVLCGPATGADCAEQTSGGVVLRPGGYHFSEEGAAVAVPLLLEAVRLPE